MSKASELFALMGKGSSKTFSITRTEENLTFSAKFDGFPTEISASAVEALAAEKGARTSVKGDAGASMGKGNSVLNTVQAAEFVREMTADGEAAPAKAPAPKVKGSAAA